MTEAEQFYKIRLALWEAGITYRRVRNYPQQDGTIKQVLYGIKSFEPIPYTTLLQRSIQYFPRTDMQMDLYDTKAGEIAMSYIK